MQGCRRKDPSGPIVVGKLDDESAAAMTSLGRVRRHSPAFKYLNWRKVLLRLTDRVFDAIGPS
jgi:hypothetical protein